MDQITLDRLKIAVDVAKHFSTTASAVIVLMATFIDKMPKPLHAAEWLYLALKFLIACLAGSVGYLFGARTLWLLCRIRDLCTCLQ